MTSDGYKVRAYDGPTPQGGVWNSLPVPSTIGNIRPDVWGVIPNTHALALGEAKTASDLCSAHTRQQLNVLRNLLEKQQDWTVKVYVAVPRSAVQDLDRALIATGLIANRQVVRLHIPDCLLSEESREFA